MQGFRTAEAFRNALQLSVYMASEFYEPVLVTDTETWVGLGVRDLDLPWSNVYVELDDLDVDHILWSAGKLRAMEIVDPPFIHIDSDVFLSKRLPDFENMMFQNWEDVSRFKHYMNMQHTIDNTEYLRPVPRDYRHMTVNSRIPNAGVVGCRDKAFRDRWVKQSLSWARGADWKNAALWCENNKRDEEVDAVWAALVEQVTANSVNFALGRGRIDVLFEDFTDARKSASQQGYTHLIGESKRDQDAEETVKRVLQSEYLSPVGSI